MELIFSRASLLAYESPIMGTLVILSPSVSLVILRIVFRILLPANATIFLQSFKGQRVLGLRSKIQVFVFLTKLMDLFDLDDDKFGLGEVQEGWD